jgi:Tol biopolymer transport system component
MKMRWVVVIILFGMLLILGLGAMAWGNQPRLSQVFPLPGATTVPSGSPVMLTFTRPVQPESVLDRLTIEPPQPGSLAWEGTTLTFTPDQPWPSGITITVRLEAGVRAVDWLSLPQLGGTTWAFSVETPLLAYLWPAEGPADLYALDPISGRVQRLTVDQDILDYSAASDGVTIYFSANRTDGSASLFRLDRLSGAVTPVLACPQARCQAVQVSPTGDYLAYEHQPKGEPTRVWLLPLAGGDPQPVGDESHRTRQPDWSPNGQLAFYDQTRQAFMLFDPTTGEGVVFPNQTGDLGDWLPDGRAYVSPEIIIVPGASAEALAFSHLLSYGRATGLTIDLTGANTTVEDAAPVFSLDGQWMAFARKYKDSAQWTLGRQLWVARADGSAARPLTDSPIYSHHSFAWRRDGQQIAFVRANQDAVTELPELWLINADGTRPLELVIGAFAPQWLP